MGKFGRLLSVLVVLVGLAVVVTLMPSYCFGAPDGDEGSVVNDTGLL